MNLLRSPIAFLFIVLLLLPAVIFDFSFSVSTQNQKSKIAFVMPTFTGAAYNNAFYKFYNMYGDVWGKAVTTDLQYLTGKITYDPPVDKPSTYAWIKPLQSHTAKSLPNALTPIIEDKDVHEGAIFERDGENFYDVLVFGHEEYVTQQMYDNIKKYVSQGGAAIFLDGNIFYAEVSYNSNNQTVTLVDGHSWKFDGVRATRSIDERWANETRDWLGSNYYEGFNRKWKSQDGTYLYEYQNDPFDYGPTVRKCCITLEENQYITNSDVYIILDYGLTDPNHRIATYWKPYGNGRVIVLGIYSEILVTNTYFLSFYDRLLIQYALRPPPTVEAGANQAVYENSIVTLNGSTPKELPTLKLLWTQLLGPEVILSNWTIANPTFSAPDVSTDTALGFQLIATDSDGYQAFDNVWIMVLHVNEAPRVDAGPNQIVVAGNTVTLSASDSNDVDGTIVSYSWKQTSGIPVSLSSSTSASPQFTAPSVSNTVPITFNVTVSDNEGAMGTACVTIAVNPPFAISTGGANTGNGSSTELGTALGQFEKTILVDTSSCNSQDLDVLIHKGQQVLIPVKFVNQQLIPQPYVFIQQVTDGSGYTVEINLQIGMLPPGKMVELGRPWSPPTLGKYNLDVFIWDSLDEPSQLSEPYRNRITVMQELNA